jgi:phosphatidate cytidylyltransferase
MRETILRIISAAFLVALYLFTFRYHGFQFVQIPIIASILFYLGVREFYGFSDREESKPFRKTGYFFGIVIIFCHYFQFILIQEHITVPEWTLKISTIVTQPGLSFEILLLFMAAIVSCVWQILYRPLDGAIFSITSTIFGLIYVAIPLGFFFLLLAPKEGNYFITLVSTVTFISDAGAYFGGRILGRNPAGLKISPKKTWEGYIVGNITGVLSGVFITYLWAEEAPYGYVATVVISFILSIVSVIGDLAESAMKRDAKTKDSGGLIPGHGGILDLADALFFTMPTLYFLHQIYRVVAV